MRGRTGAQSSYVYGMPRLAAPLFKAVLSQPVERATIKEKGKGRPIKIADEIVLAMRRLHERDGWTHRQIEAAYPDIRPDTIRQFLSYQTRGNLLLPRK